MNKEPKFYNKDGSLTAYSFACGYIEKKEKTNVGYKQIFMEHDCYHVQHFNYLESEQALKRIVWESFPISEGKALTQAKKLYNSIKL